jgi:hypothetical protein
MRISGHELNTIQVRQRTIDDILTEGSIEHVIEHVDFITIDVEGYELAALAGLDLERWKPPNFDTWRQLLSTSEEVPLHMDRRGYVRFMSTGCNDWYCAKSDPLATRRAIIIVEAIKALKGLKKVSLNHARRALKSF